ncbi:MAG: hypothetical protein J7604_25125, partial [Sporocytophaga sp.]|uniref:hypothetical protein n=1 Tax=Sporocytophaga sp. TaxID=2231183 RepID=UPI001B2D87DC
CETTCGYKDDIKTLKLFDAAKMQQLKMRKTNLYLIFLVMISVACSSNSKEADSFKESNDNSITLRKGIIDSITKADSSTRVISKSDSVIGIVYVKNSNGTQLKESENAEHPNSSAIEFGTKLFWIYSVDEKLKSDSTLIKVKLHNGCGDLYGYVFRYDVIDSAIVDFSIIPKEYSRELNRYPLGKNNEGNLKFKFSKIGSAEFNKYKSSYDSQVIEDTTKNAPGKKFFTLPIGNQLYKFHYNNTCEQYEYYRGDIKPLNAYAIEGCSMESCSTYLIDKSTGKLLYLDGGPYIQGTSHPYISKDETKLLIFTSGAPIDDFGTYLILYKKDPKTGIFNFAEYDSFYTKELEIEELVWVDHQTIALKGTGNTGYFKGVIIK